MREDDTHLEIHIGGRSIELRGREAKLVVVAALIVFALVSYNVVNWIVT